MRHRYAPVADSCSAARRDLRIFLVPYDLAEDLVQDLVMVVNELVANAVDHARTAFSVTVALTGRTVRIEVADGSADQPCLRPRDPSSARGHGLRIVDGLVTGWSVTRTLTGKIVRADLAIA